MEDSPDRDEYPCATLAEALPQLRRPPSPAVVRFKVQTPADDAGQVVAYVDARLVYDRLDLVCGERWWTRFGALPRALVPRPSHSAEGPPPLYVRCRLTVHGVTREDVGEGADPKAAFSDAVKRAAVHFGVGRVLYAMRAPWLRAGDGDGELRRDGRGVLFVDERTEAWCREKYERWLEERGAREFGEPLEHRVEGDWHVSGPEGGDGTAPDARSDGREAAGEAGEAASEHAAELREAA
jgi:Rad52/22 family double-strand break repair protein